MEVNLQEFIDYQFALSRYMFDCTEPVDRDSKRQERNRLFLRNPNNFDRLCLDETCKFCKYDGFSDIDNHSKDPEYKQILKLAIKNKKLKCSSNI